MTTHTEALRGLLVNYGTCLDFMAEDLQVSPMEVATALGKAEVLYRIYESKEDQSANILGGLNSNFNNVLRTRRQLEIQPAATEVP